MEYRYLGDTGIPVSALCMGTMTFGREADRESSAAMFNSCRNAGVNFFDCANAYNKGLSEQLLGEFMRDCRKELIITTKVFNQIEPGINNRGLSRRHIMAAVEASLKRLKTDYIDIYFLSDIASKDTVLYEPCIETVEEFKKEMERLMQKVQI